MIIDLEKLVVEERPFWTELENRLRVVEGRWRLQMSLDDVKRLHYLYERAAADLARLDTFSSSVELHGYLEALVARAYAQIHQARRRPHRLSPVKWFMGTFPRTFRKHVNAFWLSLAVTVVGVIFGCFTMAVDSEAKSVIIPGTFAGLEDDPGQQVADAEERSKEGMERKAMFSFYIFNNIGVSIKAFALGVTYGIGTIVILFYNGAMLGAVVWDFIVAGQGKFVAAWLLPHGSIEIPAILLAGQAGLVLAKGVIGWGDRNTLRLRMRRIAPDLVTLVAGVALLLVWAAVIEAFFSQYHEPILPYWLKIAFGCLELVMLIAFLGLAGRGRFAPQAEVDE